MLQYIPIIMDHLTHYGLGILGNCCTHGAGIVHQLRDHPRINIVTGYDKNPRCDLELRKTIGVGGASSYEAVAADPEVQILVITSDPCNKADLVDLAVSKGKAVYINKPLCHTPSCADRIVNSIRAGGVPAIFDAPMVMHQPAFNKLLYEVKGSKYGQIINYHHSFGMIFPMDFPIRERWPERFDPAEISGGGEMTNMGCYAIDHALRLHGLPKTVSAKKQTFWHPYVEADVENFGQIILDYGKYWAVLSVGKQIVNETPGSRNALTIEFESTNLFMDPGAGIFLENGKRKSLAHYISDHKAKPAIDQLLDAMEHNITPQCDIETAADGVHILSAAYQSIMSGQPVHLSLKQKVNPLFESYNPVSI